MARAIDADALYAEITGSDNKHDDQLMWEWYANMVERQPTIEPKQEWISVKDRLPEFGKKVLVCDVDAEPDIANDIHMFCLWHDEDGHYWTDGDEWVIDFENVSHWMPLPEPPETK